MRCAVARAVVTLLAEHVDDPVAACRPLALGRGRGAAAEAVVGVAAVAVVALLARLEEAVAARHDVAGRRAVAGLAVERTIIALLNPRLDMLITAPRDLARARHQAAADARIGIAGVAVVTLLSRVEDAVATLDAAATRRAVARGAVERTIIALLAWVKDAVAAMLEPTKV